MTTSTRNALDQDFGRTICSTQRLRRLRSPILILAAAASVAPSGAAQLDMQRASVSSDGGQANGRSSAPAISHSGSRVAFMSWATNLVAGGLNASPDIFVHDRATGGTVCASVTSSGARADASSWLPALSADGRYVAFISYASNLVPGDTNGVADAFVKDLSTGQIERVSVSTAGAQGDLDTSRSEALSADGRFVAFVSSASNLVPGDTNGFEDVFVRDRALGATTRVSVDSSGVQANGNCGPVPGISGDGRFVAFASEATNLVPGDTNFNPDVFVHDTHTGETTRVNVSSSGAQADAFTDLSSISADGRYVAFISNATTLAPEDTDGGQFDLFLHDRLAGMTRLVSTETPGFSFANLGGGSLSADAHYIAYQFQVSGGVSQVVFQDIQADVKTILTPLSLNWSGYAALSGSGTALAFGSTIPNLVPLDSNATDDIFVAEPFGGTPTIGSYCTAGTTTHGCTPSISGAGVPRNLAPSGFTITVSGVEGGTDGMIFYGMLGPQSVPFGSGSSVLCIRSWLQRTVVQPTGGTPGACDGTLALDWNEFTTTHLELRGWGVLGGYTVWAQGWFRDPLAPGGSNLSNALWFTVLR